QQAVIGTTPAPSSPGYSALAVEMAPGDFGTTTVLSPWVCTSICGAGGSGATGYRIANNILPGTAFVRTYQNAQNGNEFLAFLIFNSATLAVRTAQAASNATSIAFVSNPLKGSSIVATFGCNLAPCIIKSVADTQGNQWNQVAYITVGTAGTGFHG